MLRKFYQKEVLEAGLDEAGRGCLAGPVFAAAVILHPDKRIPGLNDSKLLHPEEREILRQKIEERALCFAVAQVEPDQIDRVNILNASFLAMHKAVKELSQRPGLLLVDGHMFRTDEKFSYKCIIQGDSKFQSIAAASILAKTYRDRYMVSQHEMYPVYSWDTNKGYPTETHRLAIVKHGITNMHRKSFQLSNDRQMSIFNY